MRLIISVAVSGCLLFSSAGAQAPSSSAPPARWYKGNTHTHTINSDGDSSPDEVVRWYREQRYHFLVITDHNFITPVAGLNDVFAADGKFLVLSGEEVTDTAAEKPVHVSALGARTLVAPQGGARPGEALARDVAAIQATGVLSQINHPNFGWALSLADLQQVATPQLLEVFNGHPQVNNLGGGDAPSVEALWDQWLSSGRLVYGVASDDTHDFKRPWARQAASPGRGWVMVRAARLTADDILASLSRGDFYASTGVELSDYQVTPRGVTITIKAPSWARHRVQFIGRGGQLLAQSDGPAASYTFTGREGHVRARIADSNGGVAWTQPVVVPARQ